MPRLIEPAGRVEAAVWYAMSLSNAGGYAPIAAYERRGKGEGRGMRGCFGRAGSRPTAILL